MNELLYIFYFIALSNGFPTETIITNVTRSNNSTPTLSLKRQYPKPRIVSNVYRSSPGFMSPMNPMENLLLYLLLSAGRDFAEEEYEMQKEHDRKRSPDVFSDTVGDIAVAAGNLVNGTKNTFAKIEDAFSSRGSREASFDGEQHAHPIAQEGTCMCFNRIFRARSSRHFEPVIRARMPSGSADHRLKVESRRTTKATGYKNHTAPEDAVTQQHVLGDTPPRETENLAKGSSAAPVRVVRVADLIGEDGRTSPTSKMRTLPQSTSDNRVRDLDDEMILELQQGTQVGNEDGTSKRNTIDTGGPPPWLESIKSAEKCPSTACTKPKSVSPNELVPRRANGSDRTDDDGYYFLFYSGGTENRTTANKNAKREPTTFDLITDRDDLDVTKRLPGLLRRVYPPRIFQNDRNVRGKRTMRKLQMSSVNVSSGGVHRIRIRNLVERSLGNRDKTKTARNTNITATPGNQTSSPGSSDNETDDGDDKDDDDDSEDISGDESSRNKINTYLYSVTIPTAACLLLLTLGLCIIARPTGTCCRWFLRNPEAPTGRLLPRQVLPKVRGRPSMSPVRKQPQPQQQQQRGARTGPGRPARRVVLPDDGPTPRGSRRSLRDAVVAFAKIEKRHEDEEQDATEEQHGEENEEEKERRAVPSGDTSYEIVPAQ